MKTAEKSVVQLRIQLKKFNSIEEIMNDNIMKQRLNHYVKQIRDSRNDRPDPKPGYHYKKDAVDVMMNENELTTPFMLLHYADVHNKVSSIPSSKRKVMEFLFSSAVSDVFEHYTIHIKQGDKLNVKDVKAKLNIISINQEKGDVIVEMKKVTETWPIKQLVNDIMSGNIFM